MAIRPVISVTQLERAYTNDPFDRPTHSRPGPVAMGVDENDEWQPYELERLVDRRIRRYGRYRKPIVEYRVRWKGYPPEEDEWHGEDLLDGAVEMMAEYDSRHPRPAVDEARRDAPAAPRRGRRRPR